MWAAKDLILVLGSIDLVNVWVIEVDLVFLCGPQIAWFFYEHRNLLVFWCWWKLTRFQGGGSELTWFLCGGLK